MITGGSSGLGFAFAHALAAQGMNCVLVARNYEHLCQAAEEIERTYGVQASIMQADLAERTSIEAVKKRLVSDKDPISVLINNAGTGMYDSMITQDFSSIRHDAEVMGLAPMEIGGSAAQAMRRRGVGLIITTSSVAALAPMGAYSAVKSLVKVWSDSIALKLRGTGVHVLTFLPGWVHTDFHARTGVNNDSLPSWVWMDADTVVAEVLDAAARGKTSVIPSTKFKILSFLAVHAPQKAVNKVVMKLNKGRR